MILTVTQKCVLLEKSHVLDQIPSKTCHSEAGVKNVMSLDGGVGVAMLIKFSSQVETLAFDMKESILN